MIKTTNGKYVVKQKCPVWHKSALIFKCGDRFIAVNYHVRQDLEKDVGFILLFIGWI